MTFDDASAALSAAANAPEPGSAPAPETSTPAPVTPEVDAGTTETPDSFTNIDPNLLPPELQAQYRNMQADFTRKSQEIAETRKAFDGLDPERARQSVEFINALETDPNFVLSVHGQLTEALQAAGYSPEQAAQVAAETITEEAPSLGADEDYVDPAISGLSAELNELKAWKEQQEAERYEQNLASHLQRQEMGIRAADPTLSEPEIDRIYELAFAHGGNLEAAHKSYSAWKSDVVGAYVNAKSTQASGAGVPDSTGFSNDTPPRFASLDEADKAAKQHLANILAGS
jgi:hypothetical protein